MRTQCLGAILLFALFADCTPRALRTGDEAERDSRPIVVPRTDLSGNLLESLAAHVPNMHVKRATRGANRCPEISLRSTRSYLGHPDVYVEQTRMSDTCILDQISSADVDSVEVFTGSPTMRPDLRNNPYGVIIIYRRH